MRLDIGPVFASERLTASRRWQYYALRAFGVTALLVVMGMVAYSEGTFFGGRRPVSAYTSLGRSYFHAIITVELALIMLAAPATTAGAICLDRSRGTLEHLMTTDLSAREIVIGKLLARLLPVMLLIACTLPVLALSTLMGGIDVISLVVAFAVTAAVALLACSLSLTLSIWARRPHEVVLAVYMFWAIGVIAYPLCEAMHRSGKWIDPPEWLLLANPFHIAISEYGRAGRDALLIGSYYIVPSLVLSSLLIFLAIATLRPTATGRRRPARESEIARLITRALHRLPGPSLDGNPVLWREWHRARSPRLSLLLVILVGSTIVASAARAIEIWNLGVHSYVLSDWGYEGIYAYLILVLFAGGVLAAVAPMSLSEERRRGSLDVLMTTPTSGAAIVLGKWLSLARTVPWLAAGPCFLALALAHSPSARWRGWDFDILWEDRFYACGLLAATILAHGSAVISLGLALATWLRRETRAIGVSITAFVLLSVVWPSLCLVLMDQHRQRGEYLAIGAAASPIYAVTALVTELCRPDEWWKEKIADITMSTAGVAVAAFLLLLTTMAMFDRQMGRMHGRGRLRSR
jgi:ABC-type transport system involved in multi-copper enzyme maturation permease subunit